MSITVIIHLAFLILFRFVCQREKKNALLAYLKMYHLGKLLLKK